LCDIKPSSNFPTGIELAAHHPSSGFCGWPCDANDRTVPFLIPHQTLKTVMLTGACCGSGELTLWDMLTLSDWSATGWRELVRIL